jgi:cytochrome c553
MGKRFSVVLLTVLMLIAVPGPAMSQTVKPQVGNEVDVKAKLKEVEGNPQQLERALKSGAKVASFCANCHGDGGNSIKSDVPNLAGQNAAYLLAQIGYFIDGRRYTTEFHQRLIRVLSADEKVSLVAFYARQNVIYKPSPDSALLGRGERLYQDNCAECHEDDGRGSERFARVAGQQTVYMTQALRNYRDNARAMGSRQMVNNLKGIADPDLAALVAYIAAMK